MKWNDNNVNEFFKYNMEYSNFLNYLEVPYENSRNSKIKPIEYKYF